MENNYSDTFTKNKRESRLNIPPKTIKTSQLMKLFEDKLQVILWAKKAITRAIPLMIKNATSIKLIEALSSHLEETDEQVERLAQVFAYINKRPVPIKCEVIDGLIRETEELISSCNAGLMRDAGIIAVAEKVEHYEIATYKILEQFAQTLGLTDVADLLKATIKEENAAKKKLSDVAHSFISVEKMEESAGNSMM